MLGRFASFHPFFPFLAVFCLVAVLGAGGTAAGEDQPAVVHNPVVAGTWYPASESELNQMVRDFLDKAPSHDVKGRVMAIISPHAGYIYSGQVAAYSFKAVQGKKFDSIIVIGPSHFLPFEGVATYVCDGFRTPLGTIPLDRALISGLMKSDPRIKDLPDAFMQEHSLEAELPFLQVVCPGFKLVPLVVGSPDPDTCRRLAKAIVECTKGKSVLLVASSDLSHYHPYDTAVEMDRLLLKKIEAMDTDGVIRCLGNRQCEACGMGPIMTVMFAASELGGDRCEVLKYANSGDVTGEKTSPRGVVGYGAVCFSMSSSGRDRDAGEPENKKAGIDLGLSREERAELHEIAKKAIEAKLSSNGASVAKAVEAASSPKLKEPRGAFVTLTENGSLRGCIGQIIPRMPLAEAVAAMAEEAAFRDPRFPPVRSDELPDLKIEISVLTPLHKTASPDEIEIGKHGLLIVKDGSVGVLLPQVATEYGWNRTEFLENCCLKAGLPRQTWKDKDAEVYIFSADVF